MLKIPPSKYKFEYDDGQGNIIKHTINDKVVLDDVLEEFTLFLRGVGFYVDRIEEVKYPEPEDLHPEEGNCGNPECKGCEFRYGE